MLLTIVLAAVLIYIVGPLVISLLGHIFFEFL